MRIAANILKWFGRIWLAGAVIFICLNYVMIFKTEGLKSVFELLSPFSILNWMITLITLLPGIIALIISKRILKPEAAKNMPHP